MTDFPSTPAQLIVSCYFAITTLSTVGYGDIYPISSTERVTMVVVMLSGVAFFSYIMSNFIEIIAEYNRKTGPVDKSDTLDTWMIEL
jgi:potassium voltage-gated channel Eag-related subfamily H protein 8